MILHERDLHDLALLPIERFGPGTGHPLLCVALGEGAARLVPFVRALPCPVIAIGPAGSPLADACDVRLDDAGDVARITANVAAAPIAAMVLVQHLRASATLPVADALVAESFAFATVQQGPDFRRWQAAAPPPAAPPGNASPLALSRVGGTLRLRLDDAAQGNAIGVAMRDALADAFDLALADPAIERVTLDAAGRCFSTGGAVAEFGRVDDPATAHWIRSLRLPATRAARLGPRLHVAVDGAAIGAGIELAAFAGRLTATRRSWFQLPELRYGLIPGAGGTVSIGRRIGRQRTAWLALTMRRLPAPIAHDWGLIDVIAEA